MAEAKRVIVTGATGLIGSTLCQELVQHGYEVVVFSRDPEAARARVPWAPEKHLTSVTSSSFQRWNLPCMISLILNLSKSMRNRIKEKFLW